MKSSTSIVDQKARLTSVSSTDLGETNTTESEKIVRENVSSDENKKATGSCLQSQLVRRPFSLNGG